MSSFDIISDHSKENLQCVPERVLDMNNLKMLFLEGNFISRLPDDFFYRLPMLMWLDLRNNLLETIPKSIANHKRLENLLLTNNNIQKLPNELGLLPNLKALQVSENPLVYPVRKIVVEGTRAIKSFLKKQYELYNSQSNHENQICEEDEEKLIQIVDCDQSKSVVNNPEPESCNDTTSYHHEPQENPLVSKGSRNSLRNISDHRLLQPTLKVQKIDCPSKETDKNLTIVHNIDKGESNITLKSYLKRSSTDCKLDRCSENTLKGEWLNKLRILLNDQERILQQERNLMALYSWRHQKKSVSTNTYNNNSRPSRPPFDTDPAYSKMPSRQELSDQLNTLLGNKTVGPNPSGGEAHNVNVKKLMGDLFDQLKEIEKVYTDTRSPRSEMTNAGRQIKAILDIHKKLMKLQDANDKSL